MPQVDAGNLGSAVINGVPLPSFHLSFDVKASAPLSFPFLLLFSVETSPTHRM